MSKDFEELESEILHDKDRYQRELEEKMKRKMISSNFLENKKQSEISKFGGEVQSQMINQNEEKESALQIFYKNYIKRINKILLPVLFTAICGTFTYPIAVRVARSRLFKLRNFYAIHIAISPFLAFIHINIYSASSTYMIIKQQEEEYQNYLKNSKSALNRQDQDTVNQSNEDYGKYYYRLKKKVLNKKYTPPTVEELKKFEKSKERQEIYQLLDEIEKDDYKMAYEIRSYLKNRF